MINRRRAAELVGESARDIGILVFVFAPLDAIFQTGGPPATVVIFLIALSLIFIVVGIMMETWKTRA